MIYFCRMLISSSTCYLDLTFHANPYAAGSSPSNRCAKGGVLAGALGPGCTVWKAVLTLVLEYGGVFRSGSLCICTSSSGASSSLPCKLQGQHPLHTSGLCENKTCTNLLCCGKPCYPTRLQSSKSTLAFASKVAVPTSASRQLGNTTVYFQV